MQIDEGDLDERLKQLSHAELEGLVDHECHNRAFAAFFEALAPVQRAQADEEQLLTSCAALARASTERAQALQPALEALAAERARAAADIAQLEDMARTQHQLWKATASAEAVEKLLGAAIARARARAAEVRADLQRSGRALGDEQTIDAYLDAARERHRLELMADALRSNNREGT